ncbi:MAG TPA: hypothetical protein VG408_01615 [Actinomycetota bacterium]|nr:hypothetical protein [Actinomycetota bacterium]
MRSMIDRSAEFEKLLEDLSYAVTTARAIGPNKGEELRNIVKKIRDLAADLDALSVSVVAEEREDTS